MGTAIEFEIIKWDYKKPITYTLKVDNKVVMDDITDFSLIDKEIRKYERLRFKEHVR